MCYPLYIMSIIIIIIIIVLKLNLFEGKRWF